MSSPCCDRHVKVNMGSSSLTCCPHHLPLAMPQAAPKGHPASGDLITQDGTIIQATEIPDFMSERCRFLTRCAVVHAAHKRVQSRYRGEVTSSEILAPLPLSLQEVGLGVSTAQRDSGSFFECSNCPDSVHTRRFGFVGEPTQGLVFQLERFRNWSELVHGVVEKVFVDKFMPVGRQPMVKDVNDAPICYRLMVDYTEISGLGQTIARREEITEESGDFKDPSLCVYWRREALPQASENNALTVTTQNRSVGQAHGSSRYAGSSTSTRHSSQHPHDGIAGTINGLSIHAGNSNFTSVTPPRQYPEKPNRPKTTVATHSRLSSIVASASWRHGNTPAPALHAGASSSNTSGSNASATEGSPQSSATSNSELVGLVAGSTADSSADKLASTSGAVTASPAAGIKKDCVDDFRSRATARGIQIQTIAPTLQSQAGQEVKQEGLASGPGLKDTSSLPRLPEANTSTAGFEVRSERSLSPQAQAFTPAARAPQPEVEPEAEPEAESEEHPSHPPSTNGSDSQAGRPTHVPLKFDQFDDDEPFDATKLFEEEDLFQQHRLEQKALRYQHSQRLQQFQYQRVLWIHQRRQQARLTRLVIPTAQPGSPTAQPVVPTARPMVPAAQSEHSIRPCSSNRTSRFFPTAIFTK